MAGRKRAKRKSLGKRQAKRGVPVFVWVAVATLVIAGVFWWRADHVAEENVSAKSSATRRPSPAIHFPELPINPVPERGQLTADLTPEEKVEPEEEPRPAASPHIEPVQRSQNPLLPPDQHEVLAVQIALEKHGISPGPLDGRMGGQTRAAIRAFQFHYSLETTGEPDEETVFALGLPEVVFEEYEITAADLSAIGIVPSTWLEKSHCDYLPYTSILELVAERSHAYQRLVQQLNPGADWNVMTAGQRVTVPTARMPAPEAKASLIRIKLSEKILIALDGSGRLMAQFPCSIAQRVEKRPEGVLHVKNFSTSPNYRFDPEIFPESEEARRLGRVLIIPEGPNNPVGTAWIGLDLPGYGIHGTPDPEKVGRTESHGCFRLANWNADHLVQLVQVGMPVFVEP